jgi:hypothetical protein
VLSAGVALVASTCSSPPTLASGCWGSGGGGSVSVVSSSGAWRLGGWSSQDRLWLKSQGSHRPNEAKLVVSLNKSTRTEYALRQRICTYSEDFIMAAFFSLRARGFLTTVLVVGGGFTLADCEVPTTTMVTIFAEAVEGSVPAVSAAPPAGTSSLVNSVPVTFWRLGRVEKPRDYKIDNVSMQQLPYVTNLRDSNFIPGGSTTCALRLRITRRP